MKIKAHLSFYFLGAIALSFFVASCNSNTQSSSDTDSSDTSTVAETWTPPTKSPIPFVKILQTEPGVFPPQDATRGQRKKVPVTFLFFETPDKDGWYSLDGPYTEVQGTMHIRGQGTAGYPKKSFTLNFGKDNDISIMGMPESHKWVIKSNWVDVTHLANRMAYDLYSDMGHYGVPGKYVQVYFERLASEPPLEHDGYWGLYSFELKVQHGKDMVNTPKKSDGGFIVKLNDTKDSEVFHTVTCREFEYEYPDAEDVTEEQKRHIKETLDRYEQAVLDKGDWREYMNEDAETDYFALVDAFANPDCYWINKNLFYFLNRDDKIEPVIWDFDWAYGPPFYVDYNNNPWPNIYQGGDLIYGDTNCNPKGTGWLCFPIMRYYMRDAQNVENFKQRYRNWRTGENGFEPLLSDASIQTRIDELIKPLVEGKVYKNDYERWKYDHSRYCVDSNFDFPYCKGYFEEQMLSRLRLMDEKVANLQPLSGTAHIHTCP